MNLINLKQSSLLLGFFALSVSACRKKSLYQIRISVTDANTSRVWKDTAGLTKNGGWEYSVNQMNPNSMDRTKLGGALVIGGGSSGGKNAIAYYPSSLSEEQVTTKLASEQENNPNDAVIKSVEIRFVDKKGKEVVLEKGDKFEFGSEFAQNIDIPRKATFIIKATGEQTGPTISKPKPNWWASGDEYYALSKEEANNIAKISNNSNGSNGSPNQGVFDLGKFTGNIQQLPNSYAGLAAQAYAIEGVGKRLDDARVSLKIEVLKNGAVVFSKSITHSKLAELTVSGTAK